MERLRKTGEANEPKMILALRLWVKGVTTEFPYNRTLPLPESRLPEHVARHVGHFLVGQQASPSLVRHVPAQEAGKRGPTGQFRGRREASTPPDGAAPGRPLAVGTVA